jgi:hypothetical protein
MRAARQVAGQVGQAHAHKHHVAVAQQPRGINRHQLSRRIVHNQ